MDSDYTEMITRSNTILYCEHREKTIQFYRDILKLAITYKTEWFVEFQIASQAYLSIADAEHTTILSSKGNGLILSFKVGDLEKVHSLLTKKRIYVSKIKPIWGARAFYLYDPEGHRIEFWT